MWRILGYSIPEPARYHAQIDKFLLRVAGLARVQICIPLPTPAQETLQYPPGFQYPCHSLSQSESPWVPFESEEGELAEWLMKLGISQKALDKNLKLPIVRHTDMEQVKCMNSANIMD